MRRFEKRHSTLNPERDGIELLTSYTSVITNLRIVREPDSYPETSWVLDGINAYTRELTENLDYYPSHAAAVADMPAFIERYGLEWSVDESAEGIANSIIDHEYGGQDALRSFLSATAVGVDNIIDLIVAGIQRDRRTNPRFTQVNQ